MPPRRPRSLGLYYLSRGSGTGVQFLLKIPGVLPSRKILPSASGKILATPLFETANPLRTDCGFSLIINRGYSVLIFG